MDRRPSIRCRCISSCDAGRGQLISARTRISRLSGTVAGGRLRGARVSGGALHVSALRDGYACRATITALVRAVNTIFDVACRRRRRGTTIRVYYTAGQPIATSTAGANGNTFGVYSYTTGAETWDAAAKTFANGTSPTQWQVTLDFSSLQGTDFDGLIGHDVSIPTNNIRKMRWTYAADLQAGAFERSEFQVVVSNWTVTGTNQTYSVAGPGSLRIEDDDRCDACIARSWTESRGNYSGGTIHYDDVRRGFGYLHVSGDASAHAVPGDCDTRRTARRSRSRVDGAAAGTRESADPGRRRADSVAGGRISRAGNHTVTVTHAGPDGARFLFRLSRAGGADDDSADVSGASRDHAGDGLGYGAFAGAGAGANGVDDSIRWDSRAGRIITSARCGFTNWCAPGNVYASGDGDVQRVRRCRITS